MQCDYFDAGVCRSCTLMGVPYARQLTALDAHARAELAERVPESAWLPVVSGPESHFRNKAKLAVGGTREAPTFGILDADRHGVDLRRCGLYEDGLHTSLPPLLDAVTRVGLTPFDVNRRSGELKHLVLTHSPANELMARFVLRSPGQLGRLRRAVPDLQQAVPGIRVVSANLQPEHKAVLEGAEEDLLTDAETLPMSVGGVTLHLRPDSFFQTNTVLAERLYAQAAEWVAATGARTVWDLYCGVGGFGLTAALGRELAVLGVEIAPGAVASARQSAADVVRRNPLAFFDFRVGDAVTALRGEPVPDVVVVNPPRRGIGDLVGWLDCSGASHVIYSSCQVSSLRRDLDALPAYDVAAARTYAMFPQTQHGEVLVLLERSG